MQFTYLDAKPSYNASEPTSNRHGLTVYVLFFALQRHFLTRHEFKTHNTSEVNNNGSTMMAQQTSNSTQKDAISHLLFTLSTSFTYAMPTSTRNFRGKPKMTQRTSNGQHEMTLYHIFFSTLSTSFPNTMRKLAHKTSRANQLFPLHAEMTQY